MSYDYVNEIRKYKQRTAVSKSDIDNIVEERASLREECRKYQLRYNPKKWLKGEGAPCSSGVKTMLFDNKDTFSKYCYDEAFRYEFIFKRKEADYLDAHNTELIAAFDMADTNDKKFHIARNWAIRLYKRKGTILKTHISLAWGAPCSFGQLEKVLPFSWESFRRDVMRSEVTEYVRIPKLQSAGNGLLKW